MQLCDPANTCQWFLYVAGLEIMEADSWKMLIHASFIWSSVCLILEWVWWSLMNYLDPRIRLKFKVYTVILRRVWWRERQWQSGRFPQLVWVCGSLTYVLDEDTCVKLIEGVGCCPVKCVEVESRRRVRMKASSIRNDDQWCDSQTSRWRNSSTQEHRAGDGRPSVHLKQRSREEEPGHLEEQTDERQAGVSSTRTQCADFMHWVNTG